MESQVLRPMITALRETGVWISAAVLEGFEVVEVNDEVGVGTRFVTRAK